MKTITNKNTKKLFLKRLAILGCFAIFSNSLSAQKVEILGDAMVTGQLEVMDTILFADGSQLASACLQVLQDADQDTKVTVEHLPDSDEIHLISEGETVMIIDKQRLRIIHNGNSMFIGNLAGANDDGNNGNIFIGNNAGKNNTFGSGNVYIGNDAAQSNTNGVQNVYIGEAAGSEESGANNTFLGAYSGFNNFGNQNTMIGHQSGESLSGSRNTILGASAGANASGDGNIIIGSDAGKSAVGDNQLIIHNTDSNTPLISGRFDNETITLNADATIEKNLQVKEGIDLIDLPPTLAGVNGVKFGFEGNPRFGLTASRFTIPFNPFNTLDFLHLGTYTNGTFNKTLTITQEQKVAIGTISPQTKFDIVSSNPIGHIMKIENTAPGIEGDGLEIKLNRATNGAGNNFVTFKGSEGVAGRIEGFSTLEDETINEFPSIDFSNYFDILSIENFAFTPGSLPTLSGGQLPFLSGGSFPTLNGGSFPTLNRGTFPSINPGSLPTLNGGSFGNFTLNATFDGDAFVRNILCGIICEDPEDVYTFSPLITGASFPSLSGGQLPSLFGGQLPSLSGGQFPSLSGGSFPNINPGSFPTISGGALPTLNFDFIIDPTPLATFGQSLSEVICWAIENGERGLITTNPWDVSVQKTAGFLNMLANCKNGGVTYGSKGADYAEWLEREDSTQIIKAGQIVGVRNGRISLETEHADQIMVISIMPVVLGNMPDSTKIENYEKVAFIGQSPVWVIGEVNSGDYIIASGQNDGYGLAVSEENLTINQISKVVGRAWENGDKIINLVNMAVGLKTNEMATILSRTSKKVDALESRMTQIEAALGIGELTEK